MTKPAPAPTGNALKKRHFYRFGPFRLEPEERALFRNGKDLKLTGKPFDILLVLVKNRGHLLRRDQIIHEVWSASISEGNLDVQMTKVRKTLKEKYIEAIPGQGFRFIAEVTEGFEEDSIGASPPASRNLTAWRSVVSIVIVTASGVLYLALHRKTQTIPQDTHPAAVLYRKALDYERAGDDDQAVATLDQALTQDPSYKDACVRAAYLAYELGQIPKASGYLTRCKATEAPDEALRLKAQALSQLLADNTIAAMELYQLLIDRYPRDTDAQYRFSEVATSLDRIEEAEKAVGVCLALEPENPYCRFQLMYIRIKQNRFDDVLVDYRSLPSGIRDYPWFDEPVGVAFWGNGQLDEATKTFERLSGRRGLHGT